MVGKHVLYCKVIQKTKFLKEQSGNQNVFLGSGHNKRLPLRLELQRIAADTYLDEGLTLFIFFLSATIREYSQVLNTGGRLSIFLICLLSPSLDLFKTLLLTNFSQICVDVPNSFLY